MGKKSIVLLRSNPVDPDSRVEKEANSLIKAGYEVKIVAWDRDFKYKIKESFLELNDGRVKIYKLGIPSTYGEGVKNLKPFLIFQFRLLLWLFKNRKKYHIIHACDFDTAYTAYHCSKLLKKKLVYDIFDYLFTNSGGNFSILKKYIVHLQHTIINHANATIICTEKRKDQIRGTKPKKLVIIHNSPPRLDENLPKLKLNKNKVKIVYVGVLQDKRFIEELADIIKNNKEWELHIGGFGKFEGYFKKQASEYDNIKYYGKLSYSKTLELEKSCDIMTAIYDPTVGNHYYAAPNKFYEALMLGKPLVMVKNTGMSEIVTQFNIGEVIDYNSESLKVAIENLIAKRNEWPEISFKMKKLYQKDYSWDEMEKRLISLYRELENEK